MSAISWAETSLAAGLPLVETSTSRVRRPLPAMMSRMKRSSSPLVSSVPTTSTTGGPLRGAATGVAPAPRGLVERSTPAESVRAAASMRAIGTGCDQRVGGVGLEI